MKKKILTVLLLMIVGIAALMNACSSFDITENQAEGAALFTKQNLIDWDSLDPWYRRDAWAEWDRDDRGQRYIFVCAKNGKAMNNGFSMSKPLRSISSAVAKARPGDTIVVMPGVYNETVILSRSGEPGAWITLTAHPDFMARDISEQYGFEQRENHGVVITGGFMSDCGVDVRASYVKVKGFFITSNPAGGDSRHDTAVRLRDSSNVNYGKRPLGQPYHHLIISENVIYGGGQAGIQGGANDFVYIRNNVIFQNSSPGVWMGSGISIGFVSNPLEPSNDPDDREFHYVVEGNIIYGNSNYWVGKQKVNSVFDHPWPGLTGKGNSDGNGIIIDWAGNIAASRSLIRNNIVYNNGQRGICLTYSSNAVVVNNTLYDNAWDPYYNWDWGHQGEIADVGGSSSNSEFPLFSGQIGNDRNVFVNNIIYSKPNGRYRQDRATVNGLVYSDYNIYFNGDFGNNIFSPDANFLGFMNIRDIQDTDPMFVNAPPYINGPRPRYANEIPEGSRFTRPEEHYPVDPIHWYTLDFSLMPESIVINTGYNVNSVFNQTNFMSDDMAADLKYFLDKALPAYDAFGSLRDPANMDPGAVAYNTVKKQ